MPKEKPAPAEPGPSIAAPGTDLAAELTTAKATIEHLEGELRYVTANRDAVTVERAAMWRDYCRLRAVLLQAFPEIPEPTVAVAVKAAIDAGQSH